MSITFIQLPEMLGLDGDPEPDAGGGGDDDGGDPTIGGDPDRNRENTQ